MASRADDCHLGRRLVQITPTSASISTVRYGTVRYVGPVQGTKGTWLGVEWDHADKGKHDGEHKGIRYFEVSRPDSRCASFVRAPTQTYGSPLKVGGCSLVSALRHKYIANDNRSSGSPANSSSYSRRNLAEIEIETPNMDKVQRKVAQLSKLKVVALTGPIEITEDEARRVLEDGRVGPTRDDLQDQIDYLAGQPGSDDQSDEEASRSIADAIPEVQHLDLSRTLLHSMGQVACIIKYLSRLRSLHLHQVRLTGLSPPERCEELPSDAEKSTQMLGPIGMHFPRPSLEELGLDRTRMSWTEVLNVSSIFRYLVSVSLAHNSISQLCSNQGRPLPKPQVIPLALLQELNLEGNELDSWDDVCLALGELPNLRRLHLSRNRFRHLLRLQATKDMTHDGRLPLFAKLEHISLVDNPLFDLTEALDTTTEKVSCGEAVSAQQVIEQHMQNIWASIYSLDATIASAGLRSLSATLTEPTKASSDESTGTTLHNAVSKLVETERSHWRLGCIARLPCLVRLNGTDISPAQRKDAELWWLGHTSSRLERLNTSREREQLEAREPALSRLRSIHQSLSTNDAASQPERSKSGEAGKIKSKSTLQSRLLQLTIRLSKEAPSNDKNLASDENSAILSTGEQAKVIFLSVLPSMSLKTMRPKLHRALGLKAAGQQDTMGYFAVLRSGDGDNNSLSAKDTTRCVCFELDDSIRDLRSWGFENGDELWIVADNE